MKTMVRSCVRCGAPCRFLLCDTCYAKVPPVEESLFELGVFSQERPASFESSVGLPVSVDGVWRY